LKGWYVNVELKTMYEKKIEIY